MTAAGTHRLFKKRLYVLSGFAGSGKTALLEHLCRQLSALRLQVLLNEPRADGLLATRLRPLVKGLYVLGYPAADSAERIRAALVAAANERADLVLLENDALADPLEIENILQSVRTEVGDVYELSGLLTVLDARQYFEALAFNPGWYNLLRHTHLALFNKWEGLKPAEQLALQKDLRAVNPHCMLLTAQSGRLALTFLHEKLMAHPYGTGGPQGEAVGISYRPLESLADAGLTADFAQFWQQRPAGLWRLKFEQASGTAALAWDAVGSRAEIRQVNAALTCSQGLLCLRDDADLPAVEKWLAEGGLRFAPALTADVVAPAADSPVSDK